MAEHSTPARLKRTVIVYTKPACPECDATKRRLRNLDVEFSELSILVPAALDFVKGLGYLAAPVVVVREGERVVEHWSGYKDGRCKALVR